MGRTLQRVQRQYDLLGYSGLYDAVVSTFLLGRDSSLRRRLLNPTSVPAGASVLDVGTGTGRNLPILAQLVGHGGRVTGVDVSRGMLSKARRRVRGMSQVTLVHSDVVDMLPDMDESFDVIVATYFFSVVPNTNAVADALRRALRPGGVLLVLEAGLPTVDSRLLKALVRFEEMIACADLEIDLRRLVPAGTWVRTREFRFWHYIQGVQARLTSHATAGETS